MNQIKLRPNTAIKWSLLELAGLLEDEDSHVHYGKIKKHLALHPFHLSNLSVALNEILHSSLNLYDSELQGFLLAYKNPKLLTALGDTFYDSCFIHVDVAADFYVFRPEVGCTLKGIVNKKGSNHIGILVHKNFNVSILKTSNPDWLGDLIEIGQEVKFTITHIDYTSKLPIIRGSLNRENYSVGCKLLTNKTLKRKKTIKNESFYDRGNESDNSCDSDVEKPQTLNRSKKLKVLENQVSPEKYSKKKKHLDDRDIQDEGNKKHIKKRLKLSQELNDSKYKVEKESSNDNTNSVNNTGIETNTKKKKRSEKSSQKTLLDNEDIQKDVKLEHKKHSKKHKLPDSDIDDLKVEIKVERSPKSNNITKYQLDKDNYVSHRRKSSEKNIKMSLKDSESETNNIRIKEEKNTSESEHTQGEDDRKDKITKIIKTEKFADKSSHSGNDTQNENYSNGLPTKNKRRREKSPMVDGEFETVTIKEEKLDDHTLDYTPQRKKSSRNKYIDNDNDNVNHVYDTQCQINVKKSTKKSKEIDIKSEPEEITIKVENDKIMSEFQAAEDTREKRSIEGERHKTSSKKRSKNESFRNSQSDCSTTEQEETKHNIFSPRKRSKKSKEHRDEILPENVEVKIERSSSIESLKI